MPVISVTQLTVGWMASNCYLVVNTETDECVIVDPGADAERIIACAAAYRPRAVLLTHGHFDHFGAADAVCASFGIPMYMHGADLPKLTDMDGNVSVLFGEPTTVSTPAIPVKDGDVLSQAGMDITVLHTPGHSEGSVCYLLPDHQGVITGDTLMAHGYGRTDFPGGDYRALKNSLRLLFHLTPRMRAYPGHEELGYVGREEA